MVDYRSIGTRTRAKSRGDKTVQSISGGEKSRQRQSSHRRLPYSAEEDVLLWDLVKQGFNWEEIGKRFGDASVAEVWILCGHTGLKN
jgi:hypothetical protein